MYLVAVSFAGRVHIESTFVSEVMNPAYHNSFNKEEHIQSRGIMQFFSHSKKWEKMS